MPKPILPRLPRMLAGLLILAATACSDATGPGDGTATISGTVVATTPIQAGRIAAYTSQAALEADERAYEAPLQGGPGEYTFRLEGLAPGDYALGVCGRVGTLTSCEAVSTDQRIPRVFRVVAGQEVRVRITL